MAPRKGLLVFLLVSLLFMNANALCVIGIAQINLLCAISDILPILPLCSLDHVLSNLLSAGTCQDTLLSLDLSTSRDLKLAIDTDILGIEASLSGSGSLNIELGSVTIAQDVILDGKTLVNVAQGVSAVIGGTLQLASKGVLNLAGNLAVQGGAVISGQVNLKGALSRTATQSVWLTSPAPILVSGTQTNPASIAGNGGVDATVQFDGFATTGVPTEQSHVYIVKDFIINTAAFLKLGGNVSVGGLANVFGRLHLQGTRVSGRNQNAWLNPNNVMYMSGTETEKARMTGNGGINGDVILGDYAGLAAGNSPGVLYYNGNVQMAYNSFMEIEVAGRTGPQYDQYIIQKNLYRDGYLYINLINGFYPNSNDKLGFGAHLGSTGVFHTILTATAYDVLPIYSNKSTGFVYQDPVIPAYCTCVNAV